MKIEGKNTKIEIDVNKFVDNGKDPLESDMIEYIKKMLEVFENGFCITCARCYALRNEGAVLLKKARKRRKK